jgi:uncharacterized protein YihD (DUF1040 family)
MRDPNRIDLIIEALRETWHNHPDMRLGQLIVNISNPTERCPEIFNIEDDILANRLKEWRKKHEDLIP